MRVPAAMEERRWATVLFADLSGFTRLSERTDPEDVRALIDRCMGAMAEVVDKFGGFVSRVSGDEMLALFGAPVAHDDDPERAVRTALEMQVCAAEKAEEFGRLPLRVGVNTGEMMFAPVGPPGAREHTVMGDAVNTAKRLQTAAPVGGVLVGDETYRATRNAIRYEPSGSIEAKGKEDGVTAWLAVESLSEASERPISEAPIVGRSREFDLLRTIWEAAKAEARPHLVTVTGAPGVGKTRLGLEFVAEVGDTLVLRGRCLPYGERTGYGAFAEQMKAAAGIYETDAAPAAREKLRAFVAGLLPPEDASEVGAHVGSLLGLGTDEAPADRQPLFFSARRLIEALAGRRPLILVFEDVHWADHSLLDLIEALAGRVRDAPVLLLALARPELVDRRPSWPGGLVATTTLNLDGLSVADSRALATRLLPKVADDGVLDRLADVSGGNPLFLEELAASYSERTAELAERLPTTIQGIIAARLDALPGTERRILLDAAVVGKIFWRGVLEAVAPDEPVWEALDALQGRDLVRREASSRIEGDEEYSFKHMLIREVAYATLPKAARRERHAKVAAFIERAAGDRIPEHASLLAHHFREAGDTARAVDYLVVAAEQAGRSFAPAEEIMLYDQALELMDPEDGRRDEALLARGLARARAGDMPKAAEELDELIPRLDGRDLANALATRGKVAFWLSGTEALIRCAEELDRYGERLDDDTSRALGLAMRCYATSITGALPESIELGERALDLWTPEAPAGELGFLLGLFGLTYYWLGDLDRALELQQRGFEVSRGLPTLDAVLVAGANYALSLAAIGRYEEALELLQQTVARGNDAELAPRWTPRALNMWAGTLRELGDLEGARDLNRRAIQGAEGVFPTGAVQGHVDLLFTDLIEGEIGRAQTGWPKLMERAGDLHGFHEWLVQNRLLAARAEIALAAGRPEEAADAAVEAVEHADRYGRLKYATRARCTLADALAGTGHQAEALEHARRAATDAERLKHRPTLWQAYAQLGGILHATGDDAGAEDAYARARRAVDEVAQALTPERREIFLASEPVPAVPT